MDMGTPSMTVTAPELNRSYDVKPSRAVESFQEPDYIPQPLPKEPAAPKEAKPKMGERMRGVFGSLFD
ncbi:cell division protein FtsA C-terminal domain-containing protein [Streptococcus cuniculipharyngis]|uniref:cell division protein FtsA C-terminal domain-containing protein n=1 Tax=Streptococcus cuniculipharyngis TaxID=1562651 RepID=UPI003CCC6854